MDEPISALDNQALTSALKEDYLRISKLTIKDLFESDQNRFESLMIECADLKIDFSKNKIDKTTLEHLADLANHSKLSEQIEKLYSGYPINNTENRAALHTALRAPIDKSPNSVSSLIQPAMEKLKSIAKEISTGKWKGHTGKAIKDVVNIGIGGSDLGPAMAVQALDFYKTNQDLRFHFVSNVDPSDIQTTLALCNPETTLFIVASKTFTTLETISNASTAKIWLQNQVGGQQNAIEKHFIAISTNTERAEEFGISSRNILPMWDWVGGRYSIWSTIGLPLCIAIGPDQFQEFLDGAYKIDKHFKNTITTENAPIIMALLSIWYSEHFSADSHCILCYDHYLKEFPNYLQQLDMESNGKHVTREGKQVKHKTGIPIWGGIGSNSQHSFHQLFHQGTSFVPTEFIVGINSCNPTSNQHDLLFSNCLAQSQALMQGRQKQQIKEELQAAGHTTEQVEQLTPHKIIPGDKPSTTIIYNKLTPSILGQLIALYEHKIFAQSVIWNINPFDQWGVELGKQLSGVITKELDKEEISEELDPSTAGLIGIFKELKDQKKGRQ